MVRLRWNAAKEECGELSADLLSRNPTTDIGSCARAVSGHAAEQRDELAPTDKERHFVPPAGRGQCGGIVSQSLQTRLALRNQPGWLASSQSDLGVLKDLNADPRAI